MLRSYSANSYKNLKNSGLPVEVRYCLKVKMASSQKGERQSIKEAVLWYKLHIMSADLEKCCSLHLSNKFVLHSPCMGMYFSSHVASFIRNGPNPQPESSYDNSQQKKHGFVFQRDCTSCIQYIWKKKKNQREWKSPSYLLPCVISFTVYLIGTNTFIHRLSKHLSNAVFNYSCC